MAASRAGRLARALARELAVIDPRRPIGPDDLFPEDESPAPRLVRFLSDEGLPHFGLVLESHRGVPRKLLDLTTRHGLGPGLLELVSLGGFEVAQQEIEEHDPERADPHHVRLEREELAHRLLPPVDIDYPQIEPGERLVIGFGLTYRTHQEETGTLRPIVFPKPAAPTGAYAPVISGAEALGGRTELLDYELELGCVALVEIDLDRLDEIDPAVHFAYLMVNDVSARGPILRDRRSGYALAKGRPTFLPTGPWLVPGEHFTRDDPTLRRMVLTVIEVDRDETEGEGERHTLRQNARLEDLTLGVRELLELVSRQRTLTMPGVEGRRWPISVVRGGRRVLPAGSLLLTGTPGGTAIRSPELADKLGLVLRSLRYLRWPSESYHRHLESYHREFGFLSSGDRVSAWITGLGSQEWEVH